MTELPISPHPPSPESGSIDVFAAQVAHDFNNLLTGILGNLELMQNRVRRNGHDDYESYIEGARNAGGRAAAFAQRLLALSGRNTGDPVPTDLARLAAELVAPLRDEGHVIELDMPAATIACDPVQAEIALGELLENAIAATPPGGRITVSATLGPRAVTLVVRDTGAGMAPETLARAGQPFFTTRPNGTGRGLGLAIARRFATGLGGRLDLASARGEGTTATLILPLAAPQAAS